MNFIFRKFFIIIPLIALVGFLILPKICLADDFENITYQEMGKHLELSVKDAGNLLETLTQAFTTEIIFLEGSSSDNGTPEQRAVLWILKKTATIDVLNHLLVDAPIDVTKKIVKGGIKISRLVLAQDVSVVLKEIEKETVKRAIEYGMNYLLQKEINVAPGAMKFKYITQKGVKKQVVFQYIIIYQSIDAKHAKVGVRLYSPNSFEPPRIEGGMVFGIYHDIDEDISPFIVEMNGKVIKRKFGKYAWIDEEGKTFHGYPPDITPVRPEITVNFPEYVPDFGIKPLTLFERHLLKPIESKIKNIKVVITRVVGNSSGISRTKGGIFDIPKAVDRAVDSIWEKVKSVFAKNLLGAGLVRQEVLDSAQELSGKVHNGYNGYSDNNGYGGAVSVEKEIASSLVPLASRNDDNDDNADDLVFGSMASEAVEALPQQPVEQAKPNLKQNQLNDIAKQIALIREQISALLDQSSFAKATEDLLPIEDVENRLEKQKMQWCKVNSQEVSVRNKVILNEIAWMGTKNSSYDEWIELKNISNQDIYLDGWQVLDKAQQIKIIFTKNDIIPKNGFYLLERTDDDTVPSVSADVIYKGSLSDKSEEIYIFDSKCVLQDKVIASSEWPAGNKAERRTMERAKDLSWYTYSDNGNNNVFGTPKQENGEQKSEYNGFASNSSSNSGSGGSSGGTSLARNASYSDAGGSDTQNPVARAGLDRTAVINQRICFDASNSQDNIKITAYKWDIDANDGINWDNPDLTGKKPCISNGYSEIGGYTITLRASDSAKNVGIDTLNVNVVSSVKILITEIQIEAENKSQDFIELYNPSNQDINISKYQLKKRNQAGKESSIKVFPDNSVIRANNYFLWAKSGYEDVISADIYSSSYITDNNSIILLDPYKNVIDELVWGIVGVENPKTLDITSEISYYQSLGRKIDEQGGYQNTGDNSQDFELQNPTPKQENQSFSHYLTETEIFEQYILPDTEITSKPDILTNQNSAIFEFSCDKQDCVFEYRQYRHPMSVDMEWEVCEENLVLQDLCEGEHILQARATDLAGNIDATPAEYQWEIDIIEPITEILTNPQKITNQLQASFTFEANETVDFECKLNNAEWENCLSPHTIIDLLDGEQIFSVRATDIAGNIQTESAQYQWTIDTTITNPSLLLQDSHTNSCFYTNNTEVKIIISDNSDVAQWLLSGIQTEQPIQNNERWQAEEPDTFVLLSEQGIKTLYLWTKDDIGNISEHYSSASITLDTIAPIVEIKSFPQVLTNSISADFEFSTDEQNCVFEYRQYRHPMSVDPMSVDMEWEVCEENLVLQDLCEGEHILEARATDLAGNVSDIASYSWTVDITPPIVEFDELSEIQEQTDFKILWSSNDENAEFQMKYSDNQEIWTYFPSENEYTEEIEYNFSGEDQTTYDFQIIAKDKAGNESESQEMFVIIDVPAPILQITIEELEFIATEFGVNPDIQLLTIGNTGNADLEYTADITYITEQIGWLEIASVPEIIALAHSQEISVSIDILGLVSGNYYSTISILSNGGDKEIQVELNIEGDTISPTQILDLSAETGDEPGEIKLSWTSPVDDNLLGRAVEYEIKYFLEPITEENWADASDFVNTPVPNTADTTQNLTIPELEFALTYYFAIKSKDETGNTSLISNSNGAKTSSPVKILISEVQIGSSESVHDEYIELYNPNEEDVNLNNWVLKKKTSSGNESNLVSSSKFSGIIPSLGYFLIVNQSEPESDLYFSGQSYSIADDNTILLYDKNDNLIDKLGFGDVVDFETALFPQNPENNQTIGRKWDLDEQKYIDTDNNSQDFELQNPTPKAQNEIFALASCDYLLSFQTDDEQTWTKQCSPYLINSSYSVPVNKTLTIEPGVEVYFEPGEGNGKLIIDGTLKAIGEQDDEILFASSDASKFWSGIWFTQTSQNSELNYMKISGGGISTARKFHPYSFNNEQTIYIENTDVSIKNTTIQRNECSGIILKNSNSEIENIEISVLQGEMPAQNSAGIYIDNGSPQISNSYIKGELIADVSYGVYGYGIYIVGKASPIIEQNIIEHYNAPIYVGSSYPVFSENKMYNNMIQGVLIKGNLSQSAVWQVPGENIPYVIDESLRIMEGFTLEINHGNVIKLKSGSGVNEKAGLLVDGIMLAEGIPSKQIIFTSFYDDEHAGDTNQDSDFTAPVPGNWGTITFSADGSVLDNVVIRYGGFGDGGSASRSGFMRGAVLIKDAISISNSIIENNRAIGVQLDNDDNVEFVSVVFRNHNEYWGWQNTPSKAIYIEGDLSNPSFNNCVFENNTYNLYWRDSNGKCQASGISQPIDCCE